MSSNDQHQFKDRYMLRLPDGMRDRIKAAAEANSRSMNSEIVATLEEKYPAPIDIKKFVDDFMSRMPDDHPAFQSEEALNAFVEAFRRSLYKQVGATPPPLTEE